MESVLTGLIIITVLVLTVLTLSYSYLASQDALFASWRDMEERLGERTRTRLVALGAETKAAGATVEVTVENAGGTKLADLARWDVIVNYTSVSGAVVGWLPYGLGSNHWTASIQSASGGAEVLDPQIMNPGERMIVTISLDPVVALPSSNTATVAAPNGIGVTAVFTR